MEILIIKVSFLSWLWSLKTLQNMLLKNMLRLIIKNNKRKYCYILCYRFLKRIDQPYRAKIDRVISKLGKWVNI